MSSSLATAFVTLVPKCDTATLKSEAGIAGNTFGSSFSGKLKTAATVGAAAFAATAAGVAGATMALNDAIQATAEYGDNVDKMSQKIGMSSQSYQEWAYVMERAGASVDVLQSGMKTLSTQAQKGADEFQKLGISQEEVANLSKEDLFSRVIEGLSGMEDGTERTAISTKLLGRAASELGPLLNEGTDAINEQREMAEKYGLVMSEKAVKASADFEDSMTTLKGAMRGLGNSMMGELLPAATEISDGLAKMFTGDIDGGVEQVSQGINDIISKIEEALPTFLDNGGEILMALVTGFMERAPELLAGLGELLASVVASIPEWLPQFLAAAGQMFMGIVQAIPTILGSLLGALGSLLQSGYNAITSFDLSSAGRALIDGLVAGLSAAGGAVTDMLMSIASGAIDAFKNFFGIHSPSRVMAEMGGYITEGLAIGIDDGTKDVLDKADSLNKRFLGSFGGTASIKAGAKGSGSGNTYIIQNIDFTGDRNIEAAMMTIFNKMQRLGAL